MRRAWEDLRFASLRGRRRAWLSWLYPKPDRPTPSVLLRQNPDRRQRQRLREDLGLAIQPDGGAIVYPYMFLWRGYRLDAAQLDRFHPWRPGALDARRRELPALKCLYGLMAVTAIALSYVLADLQFLESALLALAFLSAVAAILYVRHRQKQRFETAFPDVRERRRDPHRTRKWVLLAMLTPLFGHLSTSVMTPLLFWITLAGFSVLWRPDGPTNADVRQALLIMTSVVFLPATAFVGYLAVRHIAFRIRHGRGVSVDDFHAL